MRHSARRMRRAAASLLGAGAAILAAVSGTDEWHRLPAASQLLLAAAALAPALLAVATDWLGAHGCGAGATVAWAVPAPARRAAAGSPTAAPLQPASSCSSSYRSAPDLSPPASPRSPADGEPEAWIAGLSGRLSDLEGMLPPSSPEASSPAQEEATAVPLLPPGSAIGAIASAVAAATATAAGHAQAAGGYGGGGNAPLTPAVLAAHNASCEAALEYSAQDSQGLKPGTKIKAAQAQPQQPWAWHAKGPSEPAAALPPLVEYTPFAARFAPHAAHQQHHQLLLQPLPPPPPTPAARIHSLLGDRPHLPPHVREVLLGVAARLGQQGAGAGDAAHDPASLLHYRPLCRQWDASVKVHHEPLDWAAFAHRLQGAVHPLLLAHAAPLGGLVASAAVRGCIHLLACVTSIAPAAAAAAQPAAAQGAGAPSSAGLAAALRRQLARLTGVGGKEGAVRADVQVAGERWLLSHPASSTHGDQQEQGPMRSSAAGTSSPSFCLMPPCMAAGSAAHITLLLDGAAAAALAPPATSSQAGAAADGSSTEGSDSGVGDREGVGAGARLVVFDGLAGGWVVADAHGLVPDSRGAVRLELPPQAEGVLQVALVAGGPGDASACLPEAAARVVALQPLLVLPAAAHWELRALWGAAVEATLVAAAASDASPLSPNGPSQAGGLHAAWRATLRPLLVDLSCLMVLAAAPPTATAPQLAAATEAAAEGSPQGAAPAQALAQATVAAEDALHLAAHLLRFLAARGMAACSDLVVGCLPRLAGASAAEAGGGAAGQPQRAPAMGAASGDDGSEPSAAGAEDESGSLLQPELLSGSFATAGGPPRPTFTDDTALDSSMGSTGAGLLVGPGAGAAGGWGMGSQPSWRAGSGSSLMAAAPAAAASALL